MNTALFVFLDNCCMVLPPLSCQCLFNLLIWFDCLCECQLHEYVTPYMRAGSFVPYAVLKLRSWQMLHFGQLKGRSTMKCCRHLLAWFRSCSSPVFPLLDMHFQWWLFGVKTAVWQPDLMTEDEISTLVRTTKHWILPSKIQKLNFQNYCLHR